MLKVSKSNNCCLLLVCSYNLPMFTNIQLVFRHSRGTFRSFWLNVSYTFVNHAESRLRNFHILHFIFFLFEWPWTFYIFVGTLFPNYTSFVIVFWFLDNFNGLFGWFSFFTLFVNFEIFLFKFVSDFQSLLNSELTFIPMLYFIRTLRTKDNHETTIGNNGQQ